jgi:hypothetical protein
MMIPFVNIFLGLSQENLNQILEAYHVGLHDYTTDSHGDVGSWVREASMIAIDKTISLIAGKQHATTEQYHVLDQTLLEKLIGSLLRQATERIDRVRQYAGTTLRHLLYDCELTIPGRESLEKAIPK